MRLILQLGNRVVDSIYLPADKENETEYLLSLTKQLLERNKSIVSGSIQMPNFYIEKDARWQSSFSSNLPKQHKASDN